MYKVSLLTSGQSWRTDESSNEWQKPSAYCFVQIFFKLSPVPLFPVLAWDTRISTLFSEWLCDLLKQCSGFVFKKGHCSAVHYWELNRNGGKPFWEPKSLKRIELREEEIALAFIETLRCVTKPAQVIWFHQQ